MRKERPASEFLQLYIDMRSLHAWTRVCIRVCVCIRSVALRRSHGRSASSDNIAKNVFIGVIEKFIMRAFHNLLRRAPEVILLYELDALDPASL